MHSKHIQPANENETVIAIEGLAQEITLLHITDSHMATADHRDPDALEHADRFQALFEERTPGNVPPRQLFAQALAHSNTINADATVLTGDIIHFPSQAAIGWIEQGLQSLQNPYLYTLGNHDWHFPHLDWNDNTRHAHYHRFNHLTNNSPAAQVLDLADVRLIAIDNSNYHVAAEQLDFLCEQLSTDRPCLLFIHIPIAADTLIPDVVEVWKDPIVMGADSWSEEGQKKWRVYDNNQSTLACCQLLKEQAQNLVAIFCGHVHFPHADEIHPGCMQYVTRPCYEGGYREIKLKPLG
jgi:3',5'-cyclic AMP phosphodiesterase CpdA